jgi:hypothetical protein
MSTQIMLLSVKHNTPSQCNKKHATSSAKRHVYRHSKNAEI